MRNALRVSAKEVACGRVLKQQPSQCPCYLSRRLSVLPRCGSKYLVTNWHTLTAPRMASTSNSPFARIGTQNIRVPELEPGIDEERHWKYWGEIDTPNWYDLQFGFQGLGAPSLWAFRSASSLVNDCNPDRFALRARCMEEWIASLRKARTRRERT